jgi:hypothetical protein
MTSKKAVELLEYCQKNGQICPQQQAWNRLWKMLPNRTQQPSGGWEPGLPLILHAWSDSSNLEKLLRLKEHIEWADIHDTIDMVDAYLRGLSEEEWFHAGD